MDCRFCKTALTHEFVDLGSSPPSNSFLSKEQLDEPEVYYPLRVFVCDSCFLVQIDEYKKAEEIFDQDYLYFSSYSRSWLDHSRRYVEMMCQRFGFDNSSSVIEIASNDGYLLQYFKERNVPVLGIEPTLSTAIAARGKGIETITEFFGVDTATRLAAQGRQADLLLGNNVLAHVPDINDFVAGLALALKQGGVVTMEFPHLMQLVENNQFDTIYHEHYSYLSFNTVAQIFASHNLGIFDVDELSTHGGSLRIYAKHRGDGSHDLSPRVEELLSKERTAGLQTLDYYLGFQAKVDKIKYDLLSFLIEQKRAGKLIAAYGAAAKGNTLLNYCGIKNDLIEFVVDASPHKQGKYMPASHVPIVHERHINERRPDFVLILPWNLRSEISGQLAYISGWNSKFAVAVPNLEVFGG